MRKSPNERASVKAARSTPNTAEGGSGDEPARRCILTGEHGPRAQFIRLALGPDDVVAPDVRARAPGRGAWISVDRNALETAMSKGKLKGALARAFKTSTVSVPDDLAERTEQALGRAALDRLGLEARASMLVTGSDRIEEAARKGNVRLLLHASDAGADGRRKLDQAWRIGSDSEGSGKEGLVLAADRSALSQALGRDNVVHIAVVDSRAAARVSTAIDRWHGFVGYQKINRPCENAAQGSSAGAAQAGLMA